MQERRLAAIMFTDIVGYTALMGSDEDRAFEILHKNQEIHAALIKQHDGTLIKEMGDGMLISFNQASEAVQCAIDIQQKATKELQGKIRIGIHLGDITFEGEDVFGDGVNIASRIQSIADPGGIYITESLQKAISSKKDISTNYLGEFNLKNVNYPVRTYAIQGEGLPVPTNKKIEKLTGKDPKARIFRSPIIYIIFILMLFTGIWWARSQFFERESTLSSLLVLPFDNYTGGDSLEYFVAGMHNSLIGDLSKIGSIQVKSKTTSKAYQGTEKSIPEIAEELNIGTVIEASVICIGDSVCLQVRLISAFPEEAQLWTKEYKVEKSQILNLYNIITKDISEEINVIITPQEEILLTDAHKVDNEAYDAYMKAQYSWEKVDLKSMQKALDYFQLAIDKDPEWADPYAGLANAYLALGSFFKVLPSSVTLPKVYENLGKALELDPNSAQAHYVKALNEVWIKFDWAQGEDEFLKVIELNPNDALNRMYYGHLLMIVGRSDEAAIQAKLALELDPLKPLILGLYGVVMINEGDKQSAIEHFEKAISIDSTFGFAIQNLNDIYMREAYNNRDFARWIELWNKKVMGGGRWNDECRIAVLKAFDENGQIAAMEEMFKVNKKYGNECYMSGIVKAVRYINLKKYDKAMDCLEKDYEMRDMFITYIRADKLLYDQLKDNPRYIALLEKMNLTVD